jgi:hypothetical protein
MASQLVAILSAELRKQRTFLSSDEEAALARPLPPEGDDTSGADGPEAVSEEDMALDRVRRRRLVFFTALRDRFIHEGRPLVAWGDMVAREEAAAGGTTMATQVAREVLEWGVRTSDRGAMLGGFSAKMLRWMGIILVLFGGWSLFQGARPVAVAIVVAVALLFLLFARILGNLSAERAATLVAEQVGLPGEAKGNRDGEAGAGPAGVDHLPAAARNGSLNGKGPLDG